MQHRWAAHPSLGLALALAGLHALSQPVVSLAHHAIIERPFDSTALLLLLQIALIGLQIATGCALAWRTSAASWIAAGFVAAALATTIAAATTITSDADVREFCALAIHTLGVPVIVMVALVFVRRTSDAPRDDAAAMLLVLGLTSLVVQALLRAEAFLPIARGRAATTVGDVVNLLLEVAPAILAVRAGLRLRRDPVAGMRALRLYVLAATGCIVGGTVVLVSGTLTIDSDLRTLLIASALIHLPPSLASPLLLQAYARREAGDGTAESTPLPAAPAWAALLFVPLLLTMPFALSERAASAAVELGPLSAVQGIATAIAAGAALRARRSAVGWALVATFVALAWTAVASRAVASWAPPFQQAFLEWPFAPVTVTCAVLAWLHRTANPPLPRAVARPPAR